MTTRLPPVVCRPRLVRLSTRSLKHKLSYKIFFTMRIDKVQKYGGQDLTLHATGLATPRDKVAKAAYTQANKFIACLSTEGASAQPGRLAYAADKAPKGALFIKAKKSISTDELVAPLADYLASIATQEPVPSGCEIATL